MNHLVITSGFIISPDGYTLTNDHVIAQSTRIVVIVLGHEPLEASLVLSDQYKHLALLKLPLGNLLPLLE
jgi:serine protease Do